MNIIVEFPKDRTQAGVLRVKDTYGNIVAGPFAALGKADVITATKNNNRYRNSVRRYGDTPLGEYKVIGINPSGLNTKYADESLYGPNGVIKLEPVAGDAQVAKANGRTFFLIQGGVLSSNTGLRPTNGCIRLFDKDMAILSQIFHQGINESICQCTQTAESMFTSTLVGIDDGFDEGDPPLLNNIMEDMFIAPKLILRTDQVAVYDDFLPDKYFKELFDYICLDDYDSVHVQGKWKKTWRLNDGFPLRGKTIIYKANTSKDAQKQKSSYPIGAVIDFLIERILAILPDVETIIGKPEQSWKSFSVTPWIYPMGTALSLHRDGSGVYSGSYTYYVHPEWNIHWGGHLLIMDSQTEISRQFIKPLGENKSRYKRPWLDERIENNQVQKPGLALNIFPKPNRIVFISPQSFHMISRVDQNAGQNSRISIGGFFHTKNGS